MEDAVAVLVVEFTIIVVEVKVSTVDDVVEPSVDITAVALVVVAATGTGVLVVELAIVAPVAFVIDEVFVAAVVKLTVVVVLTDLLTFDAGV